MERTRSASTDTGQSTRTYVETDVYYGDPRYTWDRNTTHFGDTYDTEMTDVVIPDYHKRSSNGEIFNNPLSQTKVYETESTGTIDRKFLRLSYHFMRKLWADIGRTHEGQIASSWILGSPSSSTMPDQPEVDVGSVNALAITRAHSNVDVSSAAILATLGESNKTLIELKRAFIKAIKIFKAIKRADVKYFYRLNKSPKELANLYMSYRYGLRPIMYDISNIMAALNVDHTQKLDRYTFRGRHSKSKTVTGDPVLSLSDNYSKVYWKGTRSTTVEARAGVLASVDCSNRLTDFGLHQPIEAAWELVPFSFIVDWFFNVGDTIASWTPNYGIKNLASWCVTTITEVSTTEVDHVEMVADPSYYTSACYANFDGCKRERKAITKTRQPNPKRSILPSLNVRLDGLKILDLAIIIKQIMSNR